MHFDSFSDLLAMGGYGLYVWLAFGISFLSLALLYVNSRWNKASLLKQALQQEQRRQRVAQAQRESRGSEV